MHALTVLADEKIVVAGAMLYWAYSRFGTVTPRTRREADLMACAVLVASALPHLLKHLFDRERPDRTVMRGAVWPALALLAASRVLLLAHYPSDVAAGLGLGGLIERVAASVLPCPDD